MGVPQDFRSLRVWQLGIELTERTYALTRQFPRDEIYGLTSQTRRTAVSVPANIAEGHGTGSTRDFLRFLAIAQGSLAELETHLLIGERLKYVTVDQIEPVRACCASEARMLRALRRRLREKTK